jgi:hypothetical protein
MGISLVRAENGDAVLSGNLFSGSFSGWELGRLFFVFLSSSSLN